MRRLLHISDIHFGPKHLPEVAAGVEAMVAERRPDLVVVSGDLTLRAKPRQFRAARAYVDRLRRVAPVLAVPGNHDVPLYRFWERLMIPFGAYRRHFDHELEPVYRDPELVAVGLNSAHGWGVKGGRIRRPSLAAAVQALATAPPGAFRLAVVHHHLMRPPGVDCEHAAWGARRALAVLAGSGVELVLSGHLHQTLALAPPGGSATLRQLLCGTTTSSRGRGPERQRNSLNWIDVEAESWSFESLFWSPGEGRFASARRERFARQPRAATGVGTLVT